jgi:hypothetical protein
MLQVTTREKYSTGLTGWAKSCSVVRIFTNILAGAEAVKG